METILNAKILTNKQKFKAKFDNERKLLIIEVKSKPLENKANKEIVKELKRFFKQEVEIVSGLKSKEKIIKIHLPIEQVLEKLANTN